MGLRRVLELVLRVLALPLAIPLIMVTVTIATGILIIADWFRRAPASTRKTYPAPDQSRASIIIINWNGRHLLERCLPSVLKAVELDGGDHEIMVVDNGSTDGSPEYVRAHYPGIQLLPLQANVGFPAACNIAVQNSRCPIVILLNNDMVVAPDFIRPLLEGFTDASVFAVSARIQLWTESAHKGHLETGKTRGFFRWGFLQVVHDETNAIDSLQPVFYAGGGASAFAKDKWLALGGFDELYTPAYWEDTDLSYRAWRHGWSVLYQPASLTYHKHRGTAEAMCGPAFVWHLTIRNQFLFMWKNFRDGSLLLFHPIALGARLVFNFVRGDTVYLKAFWHALQRIGLVWQRRRGDPLAQGPGDRQILQLASRSRILGETS